MTLGETESTPSRPPIFRQRQALYLWLGWYILLQLFQHMIWVRFDLTPPDFGYSWTSDFTRGMIDGPSQGAWFYGRWDSWRYVAIAQHGYADIRLATFFPGYPILMRALDEVVLRWLAPDMPWNHRMAWSGVIVSAVMGALATLLMYQFTWERLGEESALRGAFYLLIFPTAMFMAQLYTESTYLVFSLASLIFAYRKQFWLGGILAAYAAITRPTGVLLFFPLASNGLDIWWRTGEFSWRRVIPLGLPILSFNLFNLWLGQQGLNTFQAQEDFGRYFMHPLALCIFVQQIAWIGTNSAGLVTVGLDLLLTLFATVLSVREWKYHPGLTLYGLAAVWLPLATGQLVSQNRYVLIVIPMLFVLTRWGKHAVFDRIWTILSLLLFALYTILFTQGFWAG